jgi:hypothetical protein
MIFIIVWQVNPGPRQPKASVESQTIKTQRFDWFGQIWITRQVNPKLLWLGVTRVKLYFFLNFLLINLKNIKLIYEYLTLYFFYRPYPLGLFLNFSTWDITILHFMPHIFFIANINMDCFLIFRCGATIYNLHPYKLILSFKYRITILHFIFFFIVYIIVS